MRHARWPALPVALLALVLLVACGRGDSPDRVGGAQSGETAGERSAETARMAARLRELAAAVTDNAFSPERAVAVLRSAPAASDPRSRLRQRVDLARALLHAGDARAAAEEIERLLPEVLAEGGVFRPPQVLDVLHLQAISWLRVGEQENCVAHHAAPSCLLPIEPAARHHRPEGSRRALATYRRILALDPGDDNALWLLNLAAMTLGDWPEGIEERFRVPPAALASEGPFAAFEDRAAELGVDVLGLSGGVVADDLDGDRWPDLLVSSWGLADPLRLFLNDRRGGFRDRSRGAGLEGITGGLNLVHADVDNDGDHDVFVMRGAWLQRNGRLPNSLLRNRGDGSFDDVTESAGLLDFHPTPTAAFADYDRDGWIDLFVGNESFGQERHPARLFRSLGVDAGGMIRFADATEHAGVGVDGAIKGAAFGDVDGDQWPDLYVSRLLEPNLLLRNLGDGRFADVTAQAGVARPLHGFPVAFFDYDQDGDLDLYASAFPADYQAIDPRHAVAELLGRTAAVEPSCLYRNRGDGTFEDVAAEVGLARALYTMGMNVDDLDGDGFLDLYLGTGAPDLRALMPNRLFHNLAGRRFADVTAAARVGHLQKGHGIAMADFDADGDLDIYAVLGGAYSGDTYQNALFVNPGHNRRWITLRLEGTRSNRSAIGAAVRLDLRTPGGPRSLYRHVSSGGSFGAQSLQLEVGLGDAEALERVEVRWPSGLVETFAAGLATEHAYRLREGVLPDRARAVIDETRPPATVRRAPPQHVE